MLEPAPLQVLTRRTRRCCRMCSPTPWHSIYLADRMLFLAWVRGKSDDHARHLADAKVPSGRHGAAHFVNHGQDSRLGKINCSYSVTRLLDGATLVCGGYDEDGGPCALASRLDPVSQQWTAVTDMPGGRAGHAAVLLSNGRLLVTGGRGYDGHHSTAWMYDPAADA